MGSNEGSDPIVPKPIQDSARAPDEVSSSLVQVPSGSKKENPIYDELGSVPKKRCTFKLVFGCISIIIVIVVVMPIIVAFGWKSTTYISKTSTNNTTGQDGSLHMLKSGRKGIFKENGIKVSGDGDVVMNLFADETVHPWKLTSKHGNFSLVKKKYITIRSAGRYKVACEVNFEYQPAELKLQISRDGKSYKLGGFLQKGSRSILKVNLTLQMNDCLSVITENKASAIMNSSTFLHLGKL